jgi:hypothetical protein
MQSHAGGAGRAIRRALLRAWWWARGPRVLIASVPKCGTHLLRRLAHVVSLPASREIEWNITPAALDGALREQRGSAVVGHVLARPEILTFAAKAGLRTLFILRDPRDQVVSHLYHFRRDPSHPLYPYFASEFLHDEAGLLAVIRGFAASEHASVPPVDGLYRGFMPWLDHPSACCTTFERLIGPSGGGSAKDQVTVVQALLRHLGFPLPVDSIAAIVANRIFDPQSPTFRAGQIGSWREHFTSLHKETFKDVAGQLLIDLGYERDLDW